MRVLLDTNVVISAILFGGLPRQILEAALAGEIDLVTSPPLLAELERILTDKFELPTTMAASTRAELEALAEIVEPAAIQPVTKSSADDLVLAAAVSGRVDMIISGDKELIALGVYRDIPIMKPRAFIEQSGDST